MSRFLSVASPSATVFSRPDIGTPTPKIVSPESESKEASWTIRMHNENFLNEAPLVYWLCIYCVSNCVSNCIKILFMCIIHVVRWIRFFVYALIRIFRYLLQILSEIVSAAIDDVANFSLNRSRRHDCDIKYTSDESYTGIDVYAYLLCSLYISVIDLYYISFKSAFSDAAMMNVDPPPTARLQNGPTPSASLVTPAHRWIKNIWNI